MAHNKQDEIIGDGVPFSRIRRITGYLVGDMGRWNDAKKAEESQRVKHIEQGEYNSDNLYSPFIATQENLTQVLHHSKEKEEKNPKCKKIA